MLRRPRTGFRTNHASAMNHGPTDHSLRLLCREAWAGSEANRLHHSSGHARVSMWLQCAATSSIHRSRKAYKCHDTMTGTCLFFYLRLFGRDKSPSRCSNALCRGGLLCTPRIPLVAYRGIQDLKDDQIHSIMVRRSRITVGVSMMADSGAHTTTSSSTSSSRTPPRCSQGWM